MAACVVRGSIVTMDPRRPCADAMAVRGDRIAAVGTLAEARAAAGPGAPEHGYGSGAIVPGLIDTHNHMHWTGIQSRLVDLAKATSVADIQAAVRPKNVLFVVDAMMPNVWPSASRKRSAGAEELVTMGAIGP